MKYIALLLLPAAAVMAQSGSVAPFLDCVSYDQTTNVLTAFFGYASTNSGTVVISVGPENFVSPNPENRGQVTIFNPGTHQNAFQTTFDLGVTPSITWTLLGQSVTASNDPAEYCTACVCPAGPQGPQGSGGPTGATGPRGPLPTIRTVTVTSGTDTAIASCNGSEVVLGGSGSCSSVGAATGHLAGSLPVGSTWKVTCQAGNATAVAFCGSEPQSSPSQ